MIRIALAAHCLWFKKEGAATTIKGGTSAAGAVSGEIKATCPLPCPEPKPDPDPVPKHDPDPNPTPDPDPTPQASCDKAALSRKVDQCIEQARQAAIDCHLALITFPPPIGWNGVEAMAEYYLCLGNLRRALLECDQKAKRDTNCPDNPLKNIDPPAKLEKCPSCHDLLEESEKAPI